MASSPPKPSRNSNSAAQLDETDARAQFYLGLAAEQDGRGKDAARIWRAMIANASADAPWLADGARGAARVGGRVARACAPPSRHAGQAPEDVAAAGEMAPADRDQMVRSMVDRLAARLARMVPTSTAGCG